MNLEQQKKQARDFLRALRRADPAALARLQTHQPRWARLDPSAVRRDVALHDAQFVIAREQGFSGWTKLKAYADRSAHPQYTRLFESDPHWIIDRVHGLMRTRRSAGPAALEQIREWHPQFQGATDEQVLDAPFTEADAKLVYARQHGFDNWADFLARIQSLASAPSAQSAEPFIAAFRAVKAHDAATLATLLQRQPQLATDRGTNGNTLLNLAVSLHAPPIVEALLAAGADPNVANDRGWTPLHQAAYSNQPRLAELLLHAGADLDLEAHGSGGTPLVVALFWGHRELADLLSKHSTAPGNLRVAAGLGSLDLLDRCLDANSALLPEASAARGFYRPHSGFPEWQPSADPQEVWDEALVWACKSGRTEVLPRLVSAGARLDADPYRGTPLVWAAVCNRLETAEWLIDHGAHIDRKGTFGGATHGQGVTALHMAAQYGHLDMVRLLIRRGANPAIRDDLYGATPEGGASHFGHAAVRDYLRGLPAA